jgi:diguanylate cyclase (GGDEF)-like protein
MNSGDQFAFLLPVVLALFGIAFLIVWRWGSKPALHWGCGYLSAALGFSAQFLTGIVPIEAQALTADILFLSAFFFYGQAMLVHFGKPTHLAHRLGAFLLGLCVLAYVVNVEKNLQAELLVSDLTCAYLLAIPVICVRNSGRHGVETTLLVVVSLVVGELLVRNAVFVFLGTTGGLETFVSSPYAFVMNVGAMFGGIIMALTALAAVTVNVILRYREAAERDALTGLLNRRGFERATGWTNKAKLAVVTCDIDYFKRINDTLGHATGDTVLQGVAALLRNTLPKNAHIARFGGEEFVACIADCTLHDAYTLANASRLVLAGHDWSDLGISTQITASFGVDVSTANDHSIHDAIGRADTALYQAKRAGRNQVFPKPERQTDGANLRLISKNGS